MRQEHGSDGQIYEVPDTQKLVWQAMEETWFLWFSDDATLRSLFQDETTLTSATDLLKEYADDRLANGDFFIRDLCQRCQDYTDWRRLAKKLANSFTVTLSED